MLKLFRSVILISFSGADLCAITFTTANIHEFFTMSFFHLKLKKKKKTLWPLFMDEVQLPQG